MIRNLVIISFLAFLISSFAYSQEPFYDVEEFDGDTTDIEKFWEEEQRVNLYNNAVGGRYSNISGFGLSYSRRLGPHFEAVFAFFMHYNEKMKWEDMTKTAVLEDEKDILYDFGLELRYDIFTTKQSKVYMFCGGFFGNESNVNSSEDNVYDRFAVGGGFGFQFFLSKNIAGDFNVGYKFDREDAEETNYEGVKQPSETINTTIGFGLGVSIYF